MQRQPKQTEDEEKEKLIEAEQNPTKLEEGSLQTQTEPEKPATPHTPPPAKFGRTTGYIALAANIFSSIALVTANKWLFMGTSFSQFGKNDLFFESFF